MQVKDCAYPNLIKRVLACEVYGQFIAEFNLTDGFKKVLMF
jgi:hypothetical protein